MPSPFPGMDPFIEIQKWSGFHHLMIGEMARRLVADLRPRYEVDPEERIYLESTTDDPSSFRADVAVSTGDPASCGTKSGNAAVVDIEPTTYTLPIPQEEREPYLVLRRSGEREVVAVVELLSPTNKRTGSDGRREYLARRIEILRSGAHLIEIDLLIGGRRMPTVRPLRATTDYCAFVCRADKRPRADVFEWTVRQRLPRIPIPLAEGDSDATLDLQAVLNAVYDGAGYDYALHYREPPFPPVRAEDEAWIKQLLGTN